jgi:hypothetical protein
LGLGSPTGRNFGGGPLAVPSTTHAPQPAGLLVVATFWLPAHAPSVKMESSPVRVRARVRARVGVRGGGGGRARARVGVRVRVRVLGLKMKLAGLDAAAA